MVGSAIRKYANEKNWQIKSGVAFGAYRGYMMSMQEGSGWKSLSVASRLDNNENLTTVYNLLNDNSIKKEYRITASTVSPTAIIVTFADSIGTMKKIIAFIDWICDKLDSFGAKGVEYCSSCGEKLNGMGIPAIMNGVVYMLHEGCFTRDDEQMSAAKEEKQKQGSVAKGTLGAFAGAIIGAIPWTIVSCLGYFVAFLGFVIGIASKKGYEMLGGKETKAKGFAILASTIVGVILAESVAIMISIGILATQEGYYLGIAEIVFTFIYGLANDSSALAGVLGNIALGVLFAILGTWSTLSEIFKSTGKKADHFTRLD